MKTKRDIPLDPFDYEEADFTPGFFVAVILTVLAMLIVVAAFAYLVFSGAILLSQALNG